MDTEPARVDITHEPKRRGRNVPLYLALLPVLLCLALMVVLHLASPTHPITRMVFEPPFLLPVLNTVFIFLVGWIISYLAMRSYLSRGSPTILFLGCGMLSLGSGAFVAGWLIGPWGPNVNTIIYTLSTLLSSIFHMAGMVANVMETPLEADPARRRHRLAVAYLGLLALVALVTLAAIAGIIPPFFIRGAGPTVLRQVFVATTLALFIIASSSMMILFVQKGVRFLYWYSLGLALFAVNTLGALLQPALGSPLGWVSRSSTYLASIYFLIAVVSASREARTQGIALSEKFAEIFHRSERKISFIFASMTDCYYELDRGWRFTRINDHCLAYFGRNREQVVGQLFEDVFPEAKGSIFGEQYRKAFSEGVAVHFEVQPLVVPDKWVDVHAYPTEEGLSVFVRDITERKQAEEELVRTKTLAENRAIELQAMMEAIPAFVFITHDAESSYMTGNRATYDLLGVPLEGNVSKSAPQEEQPAAFRAMRYGQEIPADQLPVQQAAQGHEVRDYEMDLVFTNGTTRTIFGNATPLKGLDGGTNGAVGVFIDITERKRVEEALCESERRERQRAEELVALFEAVPMPVFIAHDPDCIHLTGNRLADEILRISHGNELSMSGPEEIRPRHFRALKDGRELGLDELPAQRACQGEHVKDFEFTLAFDDGIVRHVLGYGTPLMDDQGHPRGTVAVLLDITERKRMEEELRRSHDELELRVQERTQALRRQADLLELAHNAIIVRDMDNRITFWNHGAEEMYGWTRDEAKDTTIHYLLQTKFPMSRDETMMTLMREGKWEGEVEQTTRDGRKITVLSRRALQWDQAGNPAAIMEINLDITAARQAEEQLRQSQKMEAIGTLAGGIAHDFNNILAAILGFTEMAADDVADRPEVGSNLQKVLKSAMRARELVKQILAFSRKTKYERTPLSLTPLINETVQLLRASIPATVEIRLAVTASSDHILAAPVEVQQILMNLGTNASIAMQDKGGTLEISLTDIDFRTDSPVIEPDVMPGEYLQLMVKDTGIGMSPEVMKRVFEPFFTTREVGKGSGMGLAVVYGIVNDLQGAITVESAPGVGSIFRVLLPKIRTDIEKEHVPTIETPRGTERILFVDDEQMLLEWGQASLERLGYSVVALTDSTAALKTFSSDPSRFDLVITDQTMSGMTGVQLAKELLKIRPDIPVILCTGHSEAVSPETAKDAGIRQFLMKPITKQELALAIRRVLDTNAEG